MPALLNTAINVYEPGEQTLPLTGQPDQNVRMLGKQLILDIWPVLNQNMQPARVTQATRVRDPYTSHKAQRYQNQKSMVT